MSENTNDPLPTESTQSVSPVLSQKEINEQKRLTRNYFKDQIENLKPQVEFAELRARHSKAIYDNYLYSLELNKIQKAEDETIAEAKNTEGKQETKPETPIVSINKNQEVVNE